ncbi:hypothetical protein J4481_00150 [Candidatus Pacearchaeota archaeon]|nr:hypothetical protein [Candidatus Pacearchaeota archaeon]
MTKEITEILKEDIEIGKRVVAERFSYDKEIGPANFELERICFEAGLPPCIIYSCSGLKGSVLEEDFQVLISDPYFQGFKAGYKREYLPLSVPFMPEGADESVEYFYKSQFWEGRGSGGYVRAQEEKQK